MGELMGVQYSVFGRESVTEQQYPYSVIRIRYFVRRYLW